MGVKIKGVKGGRVIGWEGKCINQACNRNSIKEIIHRLTEHRAHSDRLPTVTDRRLAGNTWLLI